MLENVTGATLYVSITAAQELQEMGSHLSLTEQSCVGLREDAQAGQGKDLAGCLLVVGRGVTIGPHRGQGDYY